MSGYADISPPAVNSVLRSVLKGLMASVAPDAQGQIIQITSARSASGTSYIARNLAQIASADYSLSGLRTGLFDCDFSKLSQTDYFFAPQRMNDMAGPYDATFGQNGFWTVSNQYGQERPITDLCALYIEGRTGLAVSALFPDRLASGEQAFIRHNPEYWQALRSQFSIIFVDSPSLDRSQDALTLAPLCDSTILVADVNASDDVANQQAKHAILQSGGRYKGLLMNAGAPAKLVPFK